MGRPSDARERLIEAAKEVIYAQSYEAVSVDELCAAAGVTKSSFYHFFSSKQDLVLAALDSRWQSFKETLLKPAFSDQIPPQERILRFFDLFLERQMAHQRCSGHVLGCPLGNLALEMSTLDESIRTRVDQFFHEWIGYVEQMLREAKELGVVPASLDVAVTAQALLAYIQGVLLLAKSRNDPVLLSTLRAGALSFMQYQGEYAQ